MPSAADTCESGNPSCAALAILCALSAFPPLTMEIYIPSLPNLQAEMQASTTTTLATISVYTAGFSIMQVLLGPVSDVLGRRSMLLGGLLTYVLSCVAAAAAPSIELLLVPRITQSVGSACAAILSMAMLRDLLSAERREEVTVYFSMVRAIAPLCAPVIGSFLEALSGWRSTFVFLAVGGGATLLGSHIHLPESLTAERRQRSLNWRDLLGGIGYLLAQRRFLCWAIPEATGFAALFVYIATSSYILQQFYGVPVVLFGLLYCVTFLGAVVGSAIVPTLRRRLGLSPAAVYLVGQSICTTCAGLLVLFSFTPLATTPSVLSQACLQASMVIFTLGRSICMVPAQVQCLEPFPRRAATAAGLMGALRSGLVAIVSVLAGQALKAGSDPRLACRAIGLLAFTSHTAYMLLHSDEPIASKPPPTGETAAVAPAPTVDEDGAGGGGAGCVHATSGRKKIVGNVVAGSFVVGKSRKARAFSALEEDVEDGL